MPATTIVTRNVPDRFRGFLASCACEIAPGVFVAPRMNKDVRERVWRVLRSWFPLGAAYSVVMTWPDKNAAGGLGLLGLGVPPYEIVDHDGFAIVRTELNSAERVALKIEDENVPF